MHDYSAASLGSVFISYNHGSKSIVLTIRDRLKSAGFTVWIDEDEMCMLSHCFTSNSRIVIIIIILFAVTSLLSNMWLHIQRICNHVCVLAELTDNRYFSPFVLVGSVYDNFISTLIFVKFLMTNP